MADDTDTDLAPLHVTEVVLLDKLTPHPRNYRSHPEDQIEHLKQSLREFGFYRNIVTARDLTVLAGHGLVMAAKALDYSVGPVIRLDISADDPAALKILAADNFVSHLAVDDDRLLTEMLKEIAQTETALLGTGFDDMSLAALLMVTRPSSEIRDFDAAAEWVGMPEFESGAGKPAMRIEFEDPATRDRFVASVPGLLVTRRTDPIFSGAWSDTEKLVRSDLASVMFDDRADTEAVG